MPRFMRDMLKLIWWDEDGVRPLDEFVTGRENWNGWNEWRGGRDEVPSDFVLELIIARSPG